MICEIYHSACLLCLMVNSRTTFLTSDSPYALWLYTQYPITHQPLYPTRFSQLPSSPYTRTDCCHPDSFATCFQSLLSFLYPTQLLWTVSSLLFSPCCRAVPNAGCLIEFAFGVLLSHKYVFKTSVRLACWMCPGFFFEAASSLSECFPSRSVALRYGLSSFLFSLLF